MAEYQRITHKVHRPLFEQQKRADIDQFFRSFNKTHLNRVLGSPSSSEFSSSLTPQLCALSSSSRIYIYDVENNEIVTNITRFKTPVFCASFHPESPLIVGGCDVGLVKVVGIKKSVQLRSFKAHDGPCRVAKFINAHANILLTAGDDGKIAVCDVATGEIVRKWEAHQAYIRCGEVVGHQGMFITGSDDGFMRLWDYRSDKPLVAEWSGFTDQINCCTVMPGNFMCAVGSGPHLNTISLAQPGKIQSVSHVHQQEISALQYDALNSAYITASYDGSVSCLSSDMSVIWGFKLNAPISTMSYSPKSSHIVCGCIDGSVITRYRGNFRNDMNIFDVEKMEENEEYSSMDSFLKQFSSGHHEIKQIMKKEYKDALKDAEFKDIERKRTFAEYDQFLRKFQYANAIISVLNLNNTKIFASLLQELVLRDALVLALNGLSDETLISEFMRQITHMLSYMEYQELVLEVIDVSYQYFSSNLSSVAVIDGFHTLYHKIRKENEFQDDLLTLRGVINSMDNFQ
ncbi:hypothetical protein PCE1_002415 [Barthelona sp. PCE]